MQILESGAQINPAGQATSVVGNVQSVFQVETLPLGSELTFRYGQFKALIVAIQ